MAAQGEGEEPYLYDIPPYVVIISKFTSGLSIIGSYIILREIFADRHQTSIGGSGRHGGQQQRARSIGVIHNLLISLSISDLCSSISIFLGTLMTDANATDQRAWGSRGNTVTCEIQGFVHYLGYLASPMFNCALAATYLLLVKYRMRGGQLRPYQPFVHGGIWGLATTFAAIPLGMDWYNNGGDTCWVESSPWYCISDDDDINPDGVSCDRGGVEAYLYAAIMDLLIPIMGFVFCGICMYMIWKSVRTMEDRSSQYTNSRWRSSGGGSHTHTSTSNNPQQQQQQQQQQQGQEGETNTNSNAQHEAVVMVLEEIPPPPIPPTDRTKSKEMMRQGIFFIVAFFVTYGPPILAWCVSASTLPIGEVFWFLGFVICLPLQGLWNCLVFARQRQMITPEGKLFHYLFFDCCCCCCCHKKRNPRTRSTTTSLPHGGPTTIVNGSATEQSHGERSSYYSKIGPTQQRTKDDTKQAQQQTNNNNHNNDTGERDNNNHAQSAVSCNSLPSFASYGDSDDECNERYLPSALSCSSVPSFADSHASHYNNSQGTT